MLLRALLFLMLCPFLAAEVPAAWERVAVGPMKTSIYVGSVRLTTTEFERAGDEFSANYEAKVVPWFFWSERGKISIAVGSAELARLKAGERIEFTGVAKNHQGKPRRVSGHAEPDADGAPRGRIKVRIHVDDLTLVFDGEYQAR